MPHGKLATTVRCRRGLEKAPNFEVFKLRTNGWWPCVGVKFIFKYERETDLDGIERYGRNQVGIYINVHNTEKQ